MKTINLRHSLLLLLVAMTTPMNAQSTPPAEDPEVIRLKAEAARLTAEATLVKAQGELATAQNAQTPAVVEAARQKALAEARKAAADADKAAADANKAEIAALLPTVAGKVLEGNITADDKSGYFAQLLAYDALKSLSEIIVGEIVATKTLVAEDRVYLTATPDQLQATGLRLLVTTRLDNFTLAFGQFKKAYELDPGGSPRFLSGQESLAELAGLPALVGVAADVAAFFRQDRSIAGKAVTVDAHLMNQAVAGTWQRLRSKLVAEGKDPMPAVTFIMPGAIVRVDPVLKAKLITDKLGGMESDYTDLGARRDGVEQVIARLKLVQAEKTTALAALKAAAATPPTPAQGEAIRQTEAELRTLTSDLGQMVKHNTSLTAVLTSYRAFADSLLAVPSGETQSPLAKIFLNDILVNEADRVFLLHVSVASIGGEMETRKWLWGPGTIRHRAGAVCLYTLYRATGEIAASGLVAADRQAKEGQPDTAFIKR